MSAKRPLTVEDRIGVGLVVVLAIALGFFSAVMLSQCASPPPSPAVTAHETDCQNALALLKADHAAGKTCEEAKAHVAIAVPSCPLTFTCRAADAGSDAQ